MRSDRTLNLLSLILLATFKRPGTNYIRSSCLLSITTAWITYRSNKILRRWFFFQQHSCSIFFAQDLLWRSTLRILEEMRQKNHWLKYRHLLQQTFNQWWMYISAHVSWMNEKHVPLFICSVPTHSCSTDSNLQVSKALINTVPFEKVKKGILLLRTLTSAASRVLF